MIENSRLRDQLYLAAVIALLLLTSLMSGYVAVAIAALLLVIGLALYPDKRRTAVVSALAAAGIAILVVFIIRSLL
jgi:hypothetical protein